MILGNIRKERVEKIAGTNTITNNNLKEVTNNNTIAGASEKIIERNNTQELQLLPQAPVTQPVVQITNPDTGESVVKALENVQLKAPEQSYQYPHIDVSKWASAYGYKQPVQPPANTQPATQPLIQHTQNQASMNGSATVQAIQQNKEQIVKVDNDVKVDIKGQPINVSIDGYQVGQAVARYTTSQTIREGGGD